MPYKAWPSTRLYFLSFFLVSTLIIIVGMKTIDLYAVIAQMRKLTAKGKEFSFSFMSYNRDTGQSEGIKEVPRAVLRPAASSKEVSEADFKLFYKDLENDVPRNCWQPLIMFFNDQKVMLT